MGRGGRPSHTAVGERNSRAKLTEEQVLEMRQRYDEGGVTYDELAEEYGVHKGTISQIVNRKSWTHIGCSNGNSEQVRDRFAEARAEGWARVRSYTSAVEAGARALRRLQDRELAAWRPLGAEIIGEEAERLEELADWLTTGQSETAA